MTALKQNVDARYATAVPGRHSFDWQEVSHVQAAAKTRYMLKGQLKEYRVYPRKAEVVDADGVIEEQSIGRFIQRKHDLRPGG